MTPESPKTLLDACRYYESPKVCFETMLAVKWPDGKICCPKCGGEGVGVVASRSLLQCKAKTCRKQFSVKVDTIFEDSPLGLDKWFVAVWCIANAKNGISSHELGRALGVTQKTAWFMLHRIREAIVAVAEFHLQRYLDEQAFRFNQRDRDDAGRFQRVLRAVVGKRLTYRLLTSQGDAGFMGIK